MGRVTFQDREVIRRINENFRATWTNVHPGYRVEHLEGARFEEIKRIPSGQASENVVTLFCTPDGELLHVVPGHWKPKDYLNEIDFALSVAQAVARAGADPEARREAVIEKHRERLALLDRQWEGGPLGRMVLENVHRRMMREPLRPVSHVRGVEDYALNPVTSTLAQKVQQLQRAIQARQREGQDLRPVGEVMQGFDALLQQGKLVEAEVRVDKALGLLGERSVPQDAVVAPPGEPLSPAELPEAIRLKMQRASELAEQWKREGRDLTPVARVLNAVEPLLQQRRFREAEAVLDHGLRLLGAAPNSGAEKPATPPSGPPPAFPPKAKAGTPEALAAVVTGRALDAAGHLSADTVHQEQYAGDRFYITPDLQEALGRACAAAAGPVRLPDPFGRLCVMHAYLGQIDVQPLSNPQGGTSDLKQCDFWAEPARDRARPGLMRVEGRSAVTVEASRSGLRFHHAITLAWEGFIEMKGHSVTHLVLSARGTEKLLWDTGTPPAASGIDRAAFLVAGHPIDLECGVRYGIIGPPLAGSEGRAGQHPGALSREISRPE